MRRKYLLVGLCLGLSIFLIAAGPQMWVGIHKGVQYYPHKIIISQAAATEIIAATNVRYTDCMIKNYGMYDIFLGSSSAVETSGANEGYRLEVGEALPIQGKVNGGALYGKSLTAPCTLYIFMTNAE